MAINLVGTYVSEDGKHILDITESVSSTGQFKGEFTAKDTPEGEIVYQINNNGDSNWADTSDPSRAGIGFMVVDKAEKTSDRQFVLFDSWAGSITSTNKLLMSGSRSYTKNNDEYSVFSFENIEFIKQHAVVDSIVQDTIPVAKVNQPVKINFTFNTNGEPETPNARIEARVIPGGIITAMSHSAPSGSVFEQSEDKRVANVISVAEKSAGWGESRSITLQFDSLPEGSGDYIVGTIYYYNADNIIGVGIPLFVKLGDYS